MAEEGHISKPLPARRVLAITTGALIVGTLIVFGAILPAEFHQDPLGLGRLTGLDRLWAPAEVAFQGTGTAAPLAREYPMPFRTDVVNIPLRPGDDRTRGNELEYKVRMKKDATLIYSWSVGGIPVETEFYSDFHGQTLAPREEDITVATYRQATGTHANGMLTAPFDGIHGWYLQNQSVKAVVVQLKIAGFYELIPCCEPGNDTGLVANVPADKAFGDVPTQ
jgi:hypothetical protein